LQRLLSTGTLVGLLIATAAAFAITERLKLVKSPISATKVLVATFSPAHGEARIRIKLRHSDRVTVLVLAGSRQPVRTLIADEVLPRGPSVLRWNGRDDLGSDAKQGTYFFEVHFARQRRTILLPNAIRLDTTPPKRPKAKPNRPAFSPDGDHQADTVSIRYSLSEPAHVVAYLGTTRIVRTRSSKQRYHFEWNGKVAFRLLPPGSYRLRVYAVDLAGNRSAPVEVRVRLRYIALALHRLSAPAGATFHVVVSTDAKRYRWQLGARHGIAHGATLKLRAPASPGTYRLTVTEHGHTDRAVMLVR
jgi:hypothetical protein